MSNFSFFLSFFLSLTPRNFLETKVREDANRLGAEVIEDTDLHLNDQNGYYKILFITKFDSIEAFLPKNISIYIYLYIYIYIYYIYIIVNTFLYCYTFIFRPDKTEV